jgi:hypothetical protein
MLHLYGKKAEGDLARPFKTGGGLLESLSAYRTFTVLSLAVTDPH